MVNASPAAEQERPLSNAINAIDAHLQHARSDGPQGEEARRQLRGSFLALSAELARWRSAQPSGESLPGALSELAEDHLCAAADILANDPQVTSGTELADQVVAVLLDTSPGNNTGGGPES